MARNRAAVGAPPDDDSLTTQRMRIPTNGPHDGDTLAPEITPAPGTMDFGAVRVPVPVGGTVSVEPTTAGRIQAVHVTVPEGRLSVSALAAPRNEGLWAALATEIDASLREGGARVRSFTGEWGRELHATTDGATSVFVGVDGPCWMLYGVATGPTRDAVSLDARLRRMLRGTVVVRGKAPYPVRTVLPLRTPSEGGTAAQPATSAPPTMTLRAPAVATASHNGAPAGSVPPAASTNGAVNGAAASGVFPRNGASRTGGSRAGGSTTGATRKGIPAIGGSAPGESRPGASRTDATRPPGGSSPRRKAATGGAAAPGVPFPGPSTNGASCSGDARSGATADGAIRPDTAARRGNGVGAAATGGNRSGAAPTGLSRPSAHTKGPNRSGAATTGGNRSGAAGAGASRSGSGTPGSSRTGANRTGTNRLGPATTGANRSGVAAAGTGRFGPPGVGADRFGAATTSANRPSGATTGANRSSAATGANRSGVVRGGANTTTGVTPVGGVETSLNLNGSMWSGTGPAGTTSATPPEPSTSSGIPANGAPRHPTPGVPGRTGQATGGAPAGTGTPPIGGAWTAAGPAGPTWSSTYGPDPSPITGSFFPGAASRSDSHIANGYEPTRSAPSGPRAATGRWDPLVDPLPDLDPLPAPAWPDGRNDTAYGTTFDTTFDTADEPSARRTSRRGEPTDDAARWRAADLLRDRNGGVEADHDTSSRWRAADLLVGRDGGSAAAAAPKWRAADLLTDRGDATRQPFSGSTAGWTRADEADGSAMRPRSADGHTGREPVDAAANGLAVPRWRAADLLDGLGRPTATDGRSRRRRAADTSADTSHGPARTTEPRPRTAANGPDDRWDGADPRWRAADLLDGRGGAAAAAPRATDNGHDRFGDDVAQRWRAADLLKGRDSSGAARTTPDADGLDRRADGTHDASAGRKWRAADLLDHRDGEAVDGANTRRRRSRETPAAAVSPRFAAEDGVAEPSPGTRAGRRRRAAADAAALDDASPPRGDTNNHGGTYRHGDTTSHSDSSKHNSPRVPPTQWAWPKEPTPTSSEPAAVHRAADRLAWSAADLLDEGRHAGGRRRTRGSTRHGRPDDDEDAGRHYRP